MVNLEKMPEKNIEFYVGIGDINGYVSVSDRSQSTFEAYHPQLVFKQGNFPSRNRFKRFGCLGQAQVPYCI